MKTPLDSKILEVHTDMFHRPSDIILRFEYRDHIHRPADHLLSSPLGFRYLMSRLKNFISTPNTKLVCSPSMRTSASTQCQYSTTHEPPLLSSSASLTTSNTISLPFTYYHESPVDEDSTIRASNFEHVAAWLHHAHVTDDDGTGILFIDEIAPPSSTSPTDNDNQGNRIALSPRTPEQARINMTTDTILSVICTVLDDVLLRSSLPLSLSL